MPTIRLTKSVIDSLPTPPKETVFWDEGLPGFGVKVTPKGRRVFIVLYRTGGAGSRLRKYTIGPYGRVTLHTARGEAQKVFAARVNGRDPAGEKREGRRRLALDRIEDLVELYDQHRLAPNRSRKELRRVLEREALVEWRGRSVHQISKHDVASLINAVAARGTPYAANKLLKVLRTFFRWCVGRGILEQSPAQGIAFPAREVSRDRVLSDDELASILYAARTMGGPYGEIVELLALTGQRREEVAQMGRDEVSLSTATWMLPAARTKNGKPHVVHLSAPAIDLLSARRAASPLVFSVDGRKPFQNFSAAKRRLDALSGVTGWRLHDLRRTIVSGMARLGVAPHVADRVLNHTAGTIKGVAAVYQRYEFLPERKKALDLWGEHVALLMRNETRQPEVRAA